MSFMLIAQIAQDPLAIAWLEVAAQLHPVVLHFPIALLVIGVIAVVWHWFRGEEGIGDFAFHCFWLGAGCAIAASFTGWFLAEGETNEEWLEWHRWSSIGTTIAAIILVAIGSLSRTDARPGMVAATRLLSIVVAAGVAWSGHLGGEMKWGDGHVSEPLGAALKLTWQRAGEKLNTKLAEQAEPSLPPTDKPAEPAEKTADPTAKPVDPLDKPAEPTVAPKQTDTPAEPTDKPAEPADGPKPVEVFVASPGAVRGDPRIDQESDFVAAPPSDPADQAKPTAPIAPSKPVSFKDDLMPLLKDRCFECHSGKEAKDGIAFDHMDELIKTTGKKAVVMKGNSAKSEMFIAVMKPDGNKKRMPPPKEGARLTAQQIGLIQAWINEGAKLDN